ncbi:Esterase OVCA2 [Bagarius yarrelli]|uniref:Esterase OVCA2 n=1 Tax=Bagarius yarrelli TaxID=175774 RepID=A0A556VC85_BAGYA|nr:Esterase OVCA2 [Bagarius yarrelli]
MGNIVYQNSATVTGPVLGNTIGTAHVHRDASTSCRRYDEIYDSVAFSLMILVDSQLQDNTGNMDDNQRGWWFSDAQAHSFDARQECKSSYGLDQSLEAVQKAVKDLGPFDGILGFSQGAALVAMLCSLQEQKLDTTLNFRFAILVAGFRSACAEHQYLYEGVNITLPSLHVFGQNDKVISQQMSQDLLPIFLGADILIHRDGHFVPAASAHKHIYQEFLGRFQ